MKWIREKIWIEFLRFLIFFLFPLHKEIPSFRKKLVSLLGKGGFRRSRKRMFKEIKNFIWNGFTLHLEHKLNILAERKFAVPGKITFRITAEHGVNFKILLPYLQTYVCIKILREWNQHQSNSRGNGTCWCIDYHEHICRSKPRCYQISNWEIIKKYGYFLEKSPAIELFEDWKYTYSYWDKYDILI